MAADAPDALEASLNSDSPVLGEVTYQGEKFDVLRKPSTLRLAALAHASKKRDVEALLSALVGILEHSLGAEGYDRLESTEYAGDDPEGEFAALTALCNDIVEVSTGRPTK